MLDLFAKVPIRPPLLQSRTDPLNLTQSVKLQREENKEAGDV